MSNEKANYIIENINELKHAFRIEVLQIILGTQIDRKKIREKGSGTEIKVSDLHSDTIDFLYNYIRTKMLYQAEELSKSDITADV